MFLLKAAQRTRVVGIMKFNQNSQCDVQLDRLPGLFRPKFSKKENKMRERGIEPRPSAWKAEILPLNYSRCFGDSEVLNLYFICLRHVILKSRDL
ncbi:hypothetical protein VTP01DRAFT_7210, partial [Rhizomucor pusillus]|uniref:uncharacterized protein n=1 Tax=Rhizomucor pusillus TaxID=4840 RepID=UPI0037444A42